MIPIVRTKKACYTYGRWKTDRIRQQRRDTWILILNIIKFFIMWRSMRTLQRHPAFWRRASRRWRERYTTWKMNWDAGYLPEANPAWSWHRSEEPFTAMYRQGAPSFLKGKMIWAIWSVWRTGQSISVRLRQPCTASCSGQWESSTAFIRTYISKS